MRIISNGEPPRGGSSVDFTKNELQGSAVKDLASLLDTKEASCVAKSRGRTISASGSNGFDISKSYSHQHSRTPLAECGKKNNDGVLKRPRGRPRIYPVVIKPKRPRGRPPKDSEDFSVSTAIPVQPLSTFIMEREKINEKSFCTTFDLGRAADMFVKISRGYFDKKKENRRGPVWIRISSAEKEKMKKMELREGFDLNSKIKAMLKGATNETSDGVPPILPSPGFLPIKEPSLKHFDLAEALTEEEGDKGESKDRAESKNKEDKIKKKKVSEARQGEHTFSTMFFGLKKWNWRPLDEPQATPQVLPDSSSPDDGRGDEGKEKRGKRGGLCLPVARTDNEIAPSDQNETHNTASENKKKESKKERKKRLCSVSEDKEHAVSAIEGASARRETLREGHAAETPLKNGCPRESKKSGGEERTKKEPPKEGKVKESTKSIFDGASARRGALSEERAVETPLRSGSTRKLKKDGEEKRATKERKRDVGGSETKELTVAAIEGASTRRGAHQEGHAAETPLKNDGFPKESMKEDGEGLMKKALAKATNFVKEKVKGLFLKQDSVQEIDVDDEATVDPSPTEGYSVSSEGDVQKKKLLREDAECVDHVGAEEQEEDVPRGGVIKKEKAEVEQRALAAPATLPTRASDEGLCGEGVSSRRRKVKEPKIVTSSVDVVCLAVATMGTVVPATEDKMKKKKKPKKRAVSELSLSGNHTEVLGSIAVDDVPFDKGELEVKAEKRGRKRKDMAKVVSSVDAVCVPATCLDTEVPAADSKKRKKPKKRTLSEMSLGEDSSGGMDSSAVEDVLCDDGKSEVKAKKRGRKKNTAKATQRGPISISLTTDDEPAPHVECKDSDEHPEDPTLKTKKKKKKREVTSSVRRRRARTLSVTERAVAAAASTTKGAPSQSIVSTRGRTRRFNAMFPGNEEIFLYTEPHRPHSKTMRNIRKQHRLKAKEIAKAAAAKKRQGIPAEKIQQEEKRNGDGSASEGTPANQSPEGINTEASSAQEHGSARKRSSVGLPSAPTAKRARLQDLVELIEAPTLSQDKLKEISAKVCHLPPQLTEQDRRNWLQKEILETMRTCIIDLVHKELDGIHAQLEQASQSYVEFILAPKERTKEEEMEMAMPEDLDVYDADLGSIRQFLDYNAEGSSTPPSLPEMFPEDIISFFDLGSDSSSSLGNLPFAISPPTALAVNEDKPQDVSPEEAMESFSDLLTESGLDVDALMEEAGVEDEELLLVNIFSNLSSNFASYEEEDDMDTTAEKEKETFEEADEHSGLDEDYPQASNEIDSEEAEL